MMTESFWLVVANQAPPTLIALTGLVVAFRRLKSKIEESHGDINKKLEENTKITKEVSSSAQAFNVETSNFNERLVKIEFELRESVEGELQRLRRSIELVATSLKLDLDKHNGDKKP